MEEFIKAIITGMPSFIGLMLCVYVLREQNQKLLLLIEKLVDDCLEDEKIRISKP